MPRGIAKHTDSNVAAHAVRSSRNKKAAAAWASARAAVGKPATRKALRDDAKYTAKKTVPYVSDYVAMPPKQRAKADLYGFDTKGAVDKVHKRVRSKK